MISCCATKLCQMNGPLPAMKFDSLGRSSPFRPSTLALILIHPSQTVSDVLQESMLSKEPQGMPEMDRGSLRFYGPLHAATGLSGVRGRRFGGCQERLLKPD